MITNIAILGLGWLGIPLAKKLCELGHIVNGTVRSTNSLENLQKSNFGVFQFDLKQSEDSLPNEITNAEICILCIPPGKSFEGNEYGDNLINILNQFSDHTKYIFVSSTSVYPDKTKNASESSYKWENNQNHISNAEQQLSLKLERRLTILRMAGLIGPNRHPAKFFDGRTNIENGLSPVNLIHLLDCIQLIKLVIQNNHWGEIINGCSSNHPTREDYYTFACEKFNFKKPSFISNGNGKIVDNKKSIKLGMKYQMDNPFDYWEMENS